MARNSKKAPERRNWEPHEDAVVVQRVRDTPNNLAYAFDQAAADLGRTGDSVNKRWYSYISKSTETGAVFGLISPRGAVANMKNVRRPQKNEEPWAMLLAELAVSKLNKQDRLELMDKIMLMK